ncbi:MAG TPA: glycoside hydrolase family 3 N-terminal domain-containing protein [Tepidiformaceae bacterium]|nr:glycoside hydrolase family 3 N-terminal domain-containing protein [Tepidiformaceae bacterium]
MAAGATLIASCAGLNAPATPLPQPSPASSPEGVRRRSVIPGLARDNPPPPTLDQKLGAMILAGFTGQTAAAGDQVGVDIQQRYLGGVALFDYDVNGVPRNIASPSQLQTLDAQLQALASATSQSTLIIGTDEEGGEVARLDQTHGFPPTVSAQYLGTINDPAVTYQYAAQMAQTLRSAGLNINFAPDVDLNVNPNNPIIGALGRSFSADPDIVTSMAEAFIRAHHDNGMLTTLKHFPGHGSSTADSHLGFVNVTDTWSSIELEPFRNIVHDGLADMIMTAHIFNAHLDPDYPATLSKATITGILREQIGWDGVVSTDAMEMGAISDNYGFEQAIALAVNAGADILLYGNDGDDVVPRVLTALKGFVSDGTITEARIDQSWARIQKLKSRLAV